MTLSDALGQSLTETKAEAQDKAAVELAKVYADAIDQGGDLDKLGPKLLACLEALLMSPRARAAIKKGAGSASTHNPLDELKARRRKRSAAPVDPTAGGADA